MAQYIMIPIDMNNFFFENTRQVSQISYHDERSIEIDYHSVSGRVIVQNNGIYYWMTSPDIDHLTIHNVIEGLGYAGDQIVVTWTEWDGPGRNLQDVILNSPVNRAPMNQITLYQPNRQIPLFHLRGPFPMIAGIQNPNQQNVVPPRGLNVPPYN
jgi:hypothetical protein